MGSVGNAIMFVCISTCVYLFIFYKGQTVPYVLLPDEDSEQKIRTYITVAFSFKVSKATSFVALSEINRDTLMISMYRA